MHTSPVVAEEYVRPRLAALNTNEGHHGWDMALYKPIVEEPTNLGSLHCEDKVLKA